MGISIEQYRARIGTHNCIRMKNYPTSLEDSFRRILFMLFQLVIIMVIMLIIFVRICYLSIFCVSPLHPNLPSHCASATQSHYSIVCIYMFILEHILCVTRLATTSKFSKPLCHCHTIKSASHCATATNRIGKPLCHCHTIKSASHCATATNKIGKPLCHCHTIKSASHCATATNQIGKPLCHCHTIKSACHCAIVPVCHCYKQNRQAIVPLPHN